MTGGKDGADPTSRGAAQEAAAREDADRARRIAAGEPPHQCSDRAASDDGPAVPESEEPGLIDAMRGM